MTIINNNNVLNRTSAYNYFFNRHSHTDLSMFSILQNQLMDTTLFKCDSMIQYTSKIHGIMACIHKIQPAFASNKLIAQTLMSCNHGQY